MLDFCPHSSEDGRRSMPRGRTILANDAIALSAADWLEAIAQHGDQAAFVELFRYYAPRIKTYLRRLGVDDAAAEELAQEAMLQIWRKAALFDRRRAAASTWIFAIARNLRIDRLRQEKRPEIDLDDPMLAVYPELPADEQLAIGASHRRLHSVLKTLPTEQAAVVALSFFEDVPHSEIALRLGLPLGTVKSRLRLAMQRIRGLLEDLQ